MATTQDKPTIEMVMDAQRALIETWSGTHDQWARYDEFYQGNYKVWNLDEHRRQRGNMRPGRGRAIVDHASDAFLAFSPKWNREPLIDKNSNHKTAAQRVETGLLAVETDSARLETALFWKQLGRHGAHYGYFPVEGPTWSERDKPQPPTRFADETDKEFKLRQDIYQTELRYWNPIRLRAVHPARVLMDPEESSPRFAIKTGRMRAHQVEELSRYKSGSRQQRRTAKQWLIKNHSDIGMFDWIKTSDFYNNGWHAFLADGEMVYIEPSIAGFVPYGHAFAGWGMQPTTLEDYDPKYDAIGILHPVMDDLQMETQRMNATHTLMIRRAFQKYMTTGDTAELQRSLAGDGIGQAGQDGKEEVCLVPTPDAERFFFQEGADIDRDIEFATYSRDTAGQKQPGVVTLGQQQILTGQTNRKFAAPVVRMEDLATEVGGRILRLVDIGGTIGARGKQLFRSDIYHSYHINARFEIEDELARMRDIDLGTRLYRDRLIGFEQFHSDHRRTPDIEAIRTSLEEDDIYRDPGVRQQVAGPVAARLGFEKEFQAAREAEAAIAAGENPNVAEGVELEDSDRLRHAAGGVNGGGENAGLADLLGGGL